MTAVGMMSPRKAAFSEKLSWVQRFPRHGPLVQGRGTVGEPSSVLFRCRLCAASLGVFAVNR